MNKNHQQISFKSFREIHAGMYECHVKNRFGSFKASITLSAAGEVLSLKSNQIQ